MALLLSILTIVLYFTPVATLIRIQHWNDPKLARLKTQHFADPDNEEYANEYESYITKSESGHCIPARQVFPKEKDGEDKKSNN